MELYQLRYFLEAARQRNFTRAAEKLHLAQAALSEQMRNLESELGTPLFIRGRRQNILTPAGEILLQHAEQLLAQADNAQRAVADVGQLRAGRLVVACIPSVSACLLPLTIAAFRRDYPGVELVLAEDTSEGVAEWVESGRAELGFVQLPTTGRNFEIQQLLTERFVLLVPASRVADLRSTRLADYAAEPFIFYKGRVRESALAVCRAAGFEPRVACASGELETVRALVGAGLGLAILPELAARIPAKGVETLRFRTPKAERQIGLLTRRGHTLSKAAQVFHEMAVKAAAARK